MAPIKHAGQLNWPAMVFILLLSFFQPARAYVGESRDVCHFLPDNNLSIPVGLRPLAGINEGSFNKILSDVAEVYAPMVRRFGGTLEIRKDWQDGTVNAYASREGKTYIIKMFGGLARHQHMTNDGFTMVACHEIGHHIGGLPFYQNNWAATEGQSDYFATLKCMRFMFEHDDNENIVKNMQIDPVARKNCDSSFDNENDRAICMRSAMAGMAAGKLFADLNGSSVPKFETPDPKVVATTFESHPEAQCRLDTYYQGSLCPVDESVEIGQSDPNIGTCNKKNQHSFGLRPQCWFKPSDGGGPGPDPTPTPAPGGTAPAPTLNGQDVFTSNDPRLAIAINIDVTGMTGSGGVLLEISKPNSVFTNPNGNQPDPVGGLGYKTFRGTRGTYQLVPMRELPGFGSYQIRVMALDQRGMAVGRFSNSATLVLRNSL